MNRTKRAIGIGAAVLLLGTMLSAGASARGKGVEIDRIARALRLDTATAARLGEVMERQKEDRRSAARDLREEMSDLREMLRDEETSEGDLADRLDKISELRRGMQERQARASEEIRSILGPRKSAELLMLFLRNRNRASGGTRD